MYLYIILTNHTLDDWFVDVGVPKMGVPPVFIPFLVGGLVAIFYFPIHIGLLSSSQVTNSYFSEGWPNHQPDIPLKSQFNIPLISQFNIPLKSQFNIPDFSRILPHKPFFPWGIPMTMDPAGGQTLPPAGCEAWAVGTPNRAWRSSDVPKKTMNLGG